MDVPLSGSVIGAISLAELQGLAPDEQMIDSSSVLEYGTSQGSLKLRERIAALYSTPESDAKITAANVVITPGSLLANYLVLATLAGPGDHIICQYPTFPQLFLVPKYQGAEVSLWKLNRGKESWEANLDELKGMIRPNTKVVIINNPNNPTGAVLSSSHITSLLDLLADHPNITLLSDEVFRPLFHSVPAPPSLLDLPPSATRAVITSSMSKAYGLPGIRIGWIASPSLPLIQKVMQIRDYTTLSVSLIDQMIAAFVLHPPVMEKVLARNLGICRRSIELVGEFVDRNRERVDWLRPEGGGVAVVRIKEREGGEDVDGAKFVEGLVREKGVGVVPVGWCFTAEEEEDGDGELKGYVRISLGDGEEVLREGLGRLEGYLKGT